MKKLVVLALLAVLALTPAFSAKHGKGRRFIVQEAIALNPSVVTANLLDQTTGERSYFGPAPQVCIAGFLDGSFVSVDLPQISAGFIIPGSPSCNTPSYLLNIPAGVYDVTSMVCDYTPGSVPSNCRGGPQVTFTVQ
mgnify:CR=1 FL=1